MKTNIPDNLTAGEVIVSTGLFSSKAEAAKAIKNRGVKINGETVESMSEKIEHGDFLNLSFSFPSLAIDCLNRGILDTLMVRFGKHQWSIVRVNGSIMVQQTEKL